MATLWPMTQEEVASQASIPSGADTSDQLGSDPLLAAILVDEPLFDAGAGEYVPPESESFDYYEPGDLRCPLEGVGFEQWRGYEGPCEFARIAPGQATALAPSLSFSDDGEPEEILVGLPAAFIISAHHSGSSFGEHVLEVLGECGENGLWDTSRPVRVWVWIDAGKRMRRVVWVSAKGASAPESDPAKAAKEG